MYMFCKYICTKHAHTYFICKNPLERKVATQFLNVIAQFLAHNQHFYFKKLKKKKKSDAAPKSEEGGEKQLSFFSQKANKTVPTDQQGHFGWIKKDSTDMYKHWE